MRLLHQINGIPIPYTTPPEELVQILDTPGPKAWAAFVALGYNPSLSALQILIKFASSDDWRFRRSAIEAIAYHPHAKLALHTISNALHDTSIYVVRAACATVKELKLTEVHDEILELLKSKYPTIRQVAIATLGSIWQPVDFDQIFTLFVNEPDVHVRRDAAWVLRDHATKGNWVYLFNAWHQDQLHRHRVWACELAVEFGISEVQMELEALCSDENGHVRKAACKALDSPGDI